MIGRYRIDSLTSICRQSKQLASCGRLHFMDEGEGLEVMLLLHQFQLASRAISAMTSFFSGEDQTAAGRHHVTVSIGRSELRRNQ